jgi:hypothetical protein
LRYAVTHGQTLQRSLGVQVQHRIQPLAFAFAALDVLGPVLGLSLCVCFCHDALYLFPLLRNKLTYKKAGESCLNIPGLLSALSVWLQ